MSHPNTNRILLVGGEEDPNLLCLINTAKNLDADYLPLLVGAASTPSISWDINNNRLVIDGKPIKPGAMFIRYDVFSAMQDNRQDVASRATRWHTTLFGYAMANPALHFLNRHASQSMSNKPAILQLAKECGLNIPSTVISNDVAGYLETHDASGAIAKPVDGGDYCQRLDDLVPSIQTRGGTAPSPAIIQNKLEQPEIRIYCIGSELMAFSMASPSLDYRVRQDADIRLLDEVPQSIGEKLICLMDRLGMNFGAADLKTDPATGELCFLELNSSPMFTRFNYESSDKLSEMMIRWLQKGK